MLKLFMFPLFFLKMGFPSLCLDKQVFGVSIWVGKLLGCEMEETQCDSRLMGKILKVKTISRGIICVSIVNCGDLKKTMELGATLTEEEETDRLR